MYLDYLMFIRPIRFLISSWITLETMSISFLEVVTLDILACLFYLGRYHSRTRQPHVNTIHIRILSSKEIDVIFGVESKSYFSLWGKCLAVLCAP